MEANIVFILSIGTEKKLCEVSACESYASGIGTTTLPRSSDAPLQQNPDQVQEKLIAFK